MGFGDGGGGYLFYAPGQFNQRLARSGVAARRIPGSFRDCPATGICLQATTIAAVTLPAIGNYGCVPQFAGGIVAAFQQLAAGDDTSADTGAYEEAYQVGNALSGTVQPLSIGSRPHIVGDRYRQC